MPIITHKNCNITYAQIARTIVGMELVEEGANTIKMDGTEKQLKEYRRLYRAEAAKNGLQVLTGEFVIDGCKMACIL